MTNVTRGQGVVRDNEGDGRLEINLETRIPTQSVWFVVDLASGEYQSFVPEGYPRRERVLEESEFIQEDGEPGCTLSVFGKFVELLVVRGTGAAWVGSFGDGGEDDADGETNGRVTIDPTTLSPLWGTSESPLRIAPDDLLIGIDRKSLEYFATRCPATKGQVSSS